jgi:Protein kinase domain
MLYIGTCSLVGCQKQTRGGSSSNSSLQSTIATGLASQIATSRSAAVQQAAAVAVWLTGRSTRSSTASSSAPDSSFSICSLLQLDNVLLDGSQPLPIIKMCDFGYSKDEVAGSLCKTACGTPEYMAPEVCSCAESEG